MGSKYEAPPPINYQALLKQTQMQVTSNEKLQAEYLEFGREALADQKETNQAILDVQLPAMQQEAEQAAKMRDRYNEQGVPFEDAYLEKIGEWDSAERREARAGEITADINSSAEQQRLAEEARQRSYGIDPSQQRSGSTEAMRGAMLAAEIAKGRQAARREVEAQGLALGGEAVNIYRGLPAQTAQSYGTATQAAGSAEAAARSTTQAGIGMYGQAGQFAMNSNTMLNNGYNTANAIYGNQIQSAQNAAEAKASTLSSIGSMAGAAVGAMAMFSDERLKEDIRQIGEVRGLPVYSYRYRDGFDTGRREVGFIAQEVEELYPEAVSEVGGYKQVDYAKALDI